jgi:methionine-rich copper-binding protein CopC
LRSHSHSGPRARTLPAKGAQVIVVAVLTLLSIAFGAGQAQAHDILVATQPANGSTVAHAPSEVELTFDKPVQYGFTEVEVIGPGGTYWAAGAPNVDGNTVTAPLLPMGPAGHYTIRYRIVSADGHPVSGAAGFTLTAAGGGSPAPGPVGPRSLSADAVTTSAAAGTGAGSPFWAWLAAGCLLTVLLGLLVARRLTRE